MLLGEESMTGKEILLNTNK
ncbi:Protein of unknown function [Bacillus mobilis]|nr:Protein of unknown function [Bacillus mobilis]